MTRETKIGLLVGLAFIIVIGILLSDHLTHSTEPPPAPMSQAGPSIRSGITTPTRQQQPVGETVAPQVQLNQPVPTANDLVPRPQPVRIVEVDAPGHNEPVTITTPTNDAARQESIERKADALASDQQVREKQSERQTSHPSAAQQQFTQPQTRAPVVLRTNDPMLARLNQEAQKVGEPLVAVAGGKQTQPAAFTATRYKAESGDSLSKIASKLYGSSNKALRDAILEANPTLKDNPNLVIEGRTYIIPAVNKSNPSGQDQAAANVVNLIKTPVPLSAEPVAASAVYVVQDGDNLTRIAIDQCGDETALAALKELNRDQLDGGDLIRPGMKLKLPAKSVAINN